MKTKIKAPATITEYILSQEPMIQKILKQLRLAIKKAAPQAKEKISYGMPTFHFNRNLVHFAAWKTHIGFYPTPSAIKAFKEELKDYEYSKGAIQFPIDEKLPIRLIVKIVKFRVKEEMKENLK